MSKLRARFKKYFHSNNWAIAFVCLVLGIVTAMQFRAVTYNKEKTDIEQMRLQDVQTALLNEKHNNELLTNHLAELQKENDLIKDEQNVGKQLKSDLERAKSIAGLLPVKGDGVTIKLNSSNADEDELRLLQLINELRAADAEAISINNERVGAMSEIRSAGGRVVMNGTRILPPYEVKAIGDKTKMYTALTMLGGLKEEFEISIKISISQSDDFKIPAIRDDGTVIKTDHFTVVDEK